MTVTLRLFQWGLAAILAVVALAELITPAAPLPAIPPPHLQMPATGGDADTSAFAATWSQIALARPLFSADRRPVAAAAVANAPVAMPKLSAIVVTAAGAKAIFVGDDGKPIVLAAGGQVGGNTIESITPTGVVLNGAAGRTTLHLQFGPAESGPGPAAVPAIQTPAALLKHLLLDNE
jgi:hypothetical protein